jgi:hypothetical protein
MRNSHTAIKLLTTVLLIVTTAFAQSSDRLPVTDAGKIASAMQAGPKFVTQNATVLDWPVFARRRVSRSPCWHQRVDLPSRHA